MIYISPIKKINIKEKLSGTITRYDVFDQIVPIINIFKFVLNSKTLQFFNKVNIKDGDYTTNNEGNKCNNSKKVK